MYHPLMPGAPDALDSRASSRTPSARRTRGPGSRCRCRGPQRWSRSEATHSPATGRHSGSGRPWAGAADTRGRPLRQVGRQQQRPAPSRLRGRTHRGHPAAPQASGACTGDRAGSSSQAIAAPGFPTRRGPGPSQQAPSSGWSYAVSDGSPTPRGASPAPGRRTSTTPRSRTPVARRGRSDPAPRWRSGPDAGEDPWPGSSDRWSHPGKRPGGTQGQEGRAPARCRRLDAGSRSRPSGGRSSLKRLEQRTAHRDLNRCTGVAHSL